jgi:hypothetical protein
MAPRTPIGRSISILLATVLAAACATSAAVPGSPVGSSAGPGSLRTLPTTGGIGGLTSPAPSASAQTPPSVAPPTPTPDPSPPQTVEPVFDPPVVPHGPFEMDLYHRNDFVTEATKWYCVPAAMLTMINVMSKGADHARATQTSLYRLARKLSTKTLVGKGAEPIGWARGLEQLGFGGFDVGVFATRREAVQAVANAIRLTGRPAGLLAWRGAHSWVVSGFQATRDPAVTHDYLVTGVYIEDVWYPLVSSIWGPSEPPDTLYRVRDLKVDYLKWRRPTRRYPGMDGRYVTILPIDREVQP